ncbi:MAG: DUF3795 domain-containing protein [Candidatus Cloacimonetes bacterium]|nr:DUF3795 domain-containing protein [Candidatus Cloacimonadota bacterium]
MISYCGLACHECGAFIATQNNDDAKRKEVAKAWSREFEANIKPEDINCNGCTSQSENLFSHCFECEIRKCGIKKKVVNCGICNNYPCKIINDFHQFVPEAKKRLDEIKSLN